MKYTSLFRFCGQRTSNRATENFVVSEVISWFICDKRATWRLWGGGGENGKIVSFFSSNKGLLTVVVSST